MFILSIGSRKTRLLNDGLLKLNTFAMLKRYYYFKYNSFKIYDNLEVNQRLYKDKRHNSKNCATRNHKIIKSQ